MSDKRPSSSPRSYHIAPRCVFLLVPLLVVCTRRVIPPWFCSASSSRSLIGRSFLSVIPLWGHDPGDQLGRSSLHRSSTDVSRCEPREMTIVSNDDRHVRSCLSVTLPQRDWTDIAEAAGSFLTRSLPGSLVWIIVYVFVEYYLYILYHSSSALMPTSFDKKFRFNK